MQIARRRAALGIKTHAEFSKRSGLARATIASAEAGSASANTYARLDMWLARQEEEHGVVPPQPYSEASPMERPEDERIEFEIIGPRTEWHIKISGPPEQADALRRQVMELVKEWRVTE